MAVASAPDGTWVELAALVGRPVRKLEEALPWLMVHAAHATERAAQWTGPRYHESEFEFLPPVVQPAAFRDFDAFEGHVRACAARQGVPLPLAWYQAPAFRFANRLSLIGHGAPVWAPAGTRELDFGLALGVVIGRVGRDIPVAQAWSHVAGFTIVNDLCARDLERTERAVGLGPSKACDFAAAVGPWLVLREELKDCIHDQRLTLAMTAGINGRICAQGQVASLHFSIPQLVAQASRDATLFPGDLLSTGTVGGGCLMELRPAGVAGGWLQPGDAVELAIERIGVLRTRIEGRPVAA